MPILVSGSLVYDHIMRFPDSFRNYILPDQIHILNVCFMVDRLEQSWGGTAGNIAYTMRLLGADPMPVSVLGKDGDEYLRYFQSLKINTDFIKNDERRHTASAHITTDSDDNQITAFYNGPLDLAIDADFRSIKDLKLALITPTHKEVMKKHLRQCRELGIKTVFDPGQQITAFTGEELLKMIPESDFIIGNDYEMRLLEERCGKSALEIMKEGAILITTLGEKGSVVSVGGKEMVEVGVCPPQSFDDPTGAGDAYRAGFFVGYELGYNWKTCGQMGAVAASYAIESYGTQTHKFTNEQFLNRYEKAFNEKISLIGL